MVEIVQGAVANNRASGYTRCGAVLDLERMIDRRSPAAVVWKGTRP